jgi:Transposase DDE domain group 1
VVVAARLRTGNVASGHRAARIAADAITTARAAGAAGPILVRADSAYYRQDLVAATIRARAWFSVTARMTRTVRRAIASIEEETWTAIRYPRAIRDEQTGGWVSDAQVAEVDFTAFTGHPTTRQVPCRLVVRRVAERNDAAEQGQDQLFTPWRYHAFITNSTLGLVHADEVHRDHAIVEQTIAELKDGPLAHAPSGKFSANAAWLALKITAFNLLRAAAAAASARHARARWATLRRRLIDVPAQVASTARRLVLHLPRHWPWQTAWQDLWTAATSP